MYQTRQVINNYDLRTTLINALRTMIFIIHIGTMWTHLLVLLLHTKFYFFVSEYGGIYLDTDQVLLKSVDKFRNNDATIGLDYGTAAANSLIIAKKNAMFIKLWYESYRTFTRTDGNKHSQDSPYRLAEKHRSLVNMAGYQFSFPNVHQLSSLYSKNLPFGDRFGMHLHYKLHNRFYKKKLTIDSVKSLNTTFGAVARHILYGNTNPCGARTYIQ